MKGIYCPGCHDIVLLALHEERTCRCGACKGLYVSRQEAITNGEGIALAIGNGSLETAITRLTHTGDIEDRDYYRDNTNIQKCWVRPHEGPGNPHTTVRHDVSAVAAKIVEVTHSLRGPIVPLSCTEWAETFRQLIQDYEDKFGIRIEYLIKEKE